MPTNVLVLNKSWLVTGDGDPEGTAAAPVGSLFLREDAVPGASVYIKESGAGATGWTNLRTPLSHHVTHEVGGTDPLTGAVALTTLTASGPVTAPMLDLKEGVPVDPAAATGRLYTLDVNGYTQIEMRDVNANVVRFASDNVLIAKVSGVPIARGQVVDLAGAQGANPLVGLARADALATMPAVGLALDPGVVNAFIRVLVSGTLQLLNTAAFNEGDRLFVSPTTAGALTATLPTAPNFAQRVGIVTRSHATQGEVLVLTTAMSIPRSGTLGIVLDGGGAAITTGTKGFVEVGAACTVTAATLLSTDPAATPGSIVVDIWKATFANYPPTAANTITASAPPTLSSANKSRDTTLAGWTTAIAAGDILAFNVLSASLVTKVSLTLTVQL